mmetsp:Transcript_12135/g.28434  ORF Transcript_12135/g.28434 Transcript_12135/m.28434 type:complete len:281 (+) Transcript_12135:1579-2421(+)
MGVRPSKSTPNRPGPSPPLRLLYTRRSCSTPSLTAAEVAAALSAASRFFSPCHQIKNLFRNRPHVGRPLSSLTMGRSGGRDALYSSQQRIPISVSRCASLAASSPSCRWSSTSLRVCPALSAAPSSAPSFLSPPYPCSREIIPPSPCLTASTAASCRCLARRAPWTAFSHRRISALGSSANMTTRGGPPFRAAASLACRRTTVSKKPLSKRTESLTLTSRAPGRSRPEASAGRDSPSGPRGKAATHRRCGTVVEGARAIPMGWLPSKRSAKSPLPHLSRR